MCLHLLTWPIGPGAAAAGGGGTGCLQERHANGTDRSYFWAMFQLRLNDAVVPWFVLVFVGLSV